jgi:Raf kinase inhibitor-like YbhB/YbcL family protein
MPIQLSSPVFEDGELLPTQYTEQQGKQSPPLRWDNVPKKTKSFALLLTDADASGGPKTHWIIWNLPAEMRELPEHVTHEPVLPWRVKDDVHARQGKNEFGEIGYTAPVSVRDRPHHYTFTVYALDCILHAPPGSAKEEVFNAMLEHVLDSGDLSCQLN